MTGTCAGSGLATRAFGPAPTKQNGLAGSTSPRSSASESASFELGRRYPTARLLPHRSPRHGRIESRAGGVCRDVRTSKRPSRASGARLDRPGADSNNRKQDRSGPNAFHRVEQVRQHARAEYPEAIFLRVREASGRRRQGGIAVHRHHRSRIEAAEGRRTRSVPPHCVWHSEHRRAVFGAVGFRPGARRRDGTRYRQAARRNAE